MAQKLSRNSLQLVAIAVILIMSLSIVVTDPSNPAKPVADLLRQIVVLGTPLALLSSTAMTARVNAVRIMRRRNLTEVSGSVVFFITFISMFIATFALGVSHDFWVAQYDLLYIHGTAALEALCGFAIMMMLIRDVRPRSMAQGFVQLMIIIGLLVVSPLGDILPPQLLDVANWLSINPGGVGSAVLSFGLYFGLLSLIARIFLFREKLTAGEG
jgi:hypothetical protein